jgi:hypothetical protein
MRYSAFGLTLASSHPIPGLPAATVSADADVHIELGRRPAWFESTHLAHLRYTSPYYDANGTPMLTLGELDNGWLRLSFADGTDFLVDRPGRSVWAAWPEPLTIDDVSSYLLGPVLGFIVRLRGRVCLHASALVVDGEAFAIIGFPGAGKSTTAGAFAAGGWPVLSDDVVPISESGGGFKAYPGHPRLRLWPASVAALKQLAGGEPALSEAWGEERYHLELSGGGFHFQPTPLPLATVYVLNARDAHLDAPVISSCTGTDALMALVTHSFASTLLDRDMRAHDLATLGRLAELVPVRAVTPQGSLEQLPALVGAILADFRRQGMAHG